MHPYRTHSCGELRPSHSGERVRLSGWIHRKRDHTALAVDWGNEALEGGRGEP